MLEADTTLVVLAGGAGRRMGRPKSWLRVGDQPILDYLMKNWRWRGPTMLVTAPGFERPPGADCVDREVCDPTAGEGPLRGVMTALESGVGHAIVVAVDMPSMSGGALRWICERNAETGVLLRRDGTVESMPMLITAKALPIVQHRMSTGRRSLRGLAEEDGFEVIDVPSDWPEQIWLNANLPADWAAFCAGVLR